MQRLEQGRFESLSKIEGELKYSIGYQHLVMLLSGISLTFEGKTKIKIQNLNQTAIRHKFYWKIYAIYMKYCMCFCIFYTMNISSSHGEKI